jgi:hypothetical protein
MDSLKKRLLPKATASEKSRCTVDSTEREDAFDGSRDDAQRQCVGVVFVPGLNVERQGGCHMLVRPIRSREQDSQAKRTATVFHPCPRFTVAAKRSTSRVVLIASTPACVSMSTYTFYSPSRVPWSNNSPSGPLWCVLRAWLPSTASKVWYRNSPIAQLA